MNNQNIVPVIGAGNAVAPQNNGIANGITLAGATSNGANLALASAAAAKVLGQMQIAKAFPRDEVAVISKVINSCQRPELAEISSYTYSKGGTEVTGASVHLLKAIAAKWGNIESGYVIIEETATQAKCEAYATDLETNTAVRVPFLVKYIRHTKKGDYALTDERERYELVANMAARRERKCLESVIPADVVQAALDECRKTLEAKCGAITAERINDLVNAYGAYDVTRADLETFIQRPLSSVAPAQWVRLGTIFKSLRDGVAKKEDFFKATETAEPEKKQTAQAKGKTSAPKTIEDAIAANEAKAEAAEPKAEGMLDVEDVM